MILTYNSLMINTFEHFHMYLLTMYLPHRNVYSNPLPVCPFFLFQFLTFSLSSYMNLLCILDTYLL